AHRHLDRDFGEEGGGHLGGRLDPGNLQTRLLSDVIELSEKLVDVLLLRKLGERLGQLLLENVHLPAALIQILGNLLFFGQLPVEGALLVFLGGNLILERLDSEKEVEHAEQNHQAGQSSVLRCRRGLGNFVEQLFHRYFLNRVIGCQADLEIHHLACRQILAGNLLLLRLLELNGSEEEPEIGQLEVLDCSAEHQ